VDARLRSGLNAGVQRFGNGADVEGLLKAMAKKIT